MQRRLRWFHSALVKKYPRCSIRALYCYSDAEADPSQMAALSTMWTMILAVGAALTAMPLVFLVVVMGASGVDRVENPILSSPLWQLDGAMAAGICFLLGAVLASAAGLYASGFTLLAPLARFMPSGRRLFHPGFPFRHEMHSASS
ncbi:unnamed protein product [Closterium sp. NIES-64]|nr:unnamed protein product [Closterium sp. NIES-64]